MPHGIINSVTNLSGSYTASQAGVPVISGTNVWKSGLTQFPASISNPLVLGYRSPSAWYARVNRWEFSEGEINWVRSDGLTRRTSGFLTSLMGSEANNLVPLNPSLADDVLRKVLSEMLEDDVAFNAFMLQGKQSLRMVANLATGLAYGTDRLMMTEFKSPKQFKRFFRNATDSAISKFSGKYLEYLYGWKPLADDVENAFQSMIEGYTGPEQKRFRLRVSKGRKLKGVIPFTRSASSYWTTNWVWATDLTFEQRAKVVLHYEFPSQAGEMLPTMTPFGTLWEVTPWSFVVDWFVPIGDWIGAMEATQYAIYMRDAVLTESSKAACRNGSPGRWEVKRVPSGGWTHGFSSPPRVGGQSFYMTRKVLNPVQVLDRIRFPSFASKFGLPQASQALALLSQVLNKWF